MGVNEPENYLKNLKNRQWKITLGLEFFNYFKFLMEFYCENWHPLKFLFDDIITFINYSF